MASASLAEAIGLHWREYLMEGTGLACLTLSIAIFGTVLYSSDSPLNYFLTSQEVRSVLMGIALAATTFLIIRSPFGRRSGAHFNPAINVNLSLAPTNTAMGCCLLRNRSFHRRSRGCSNCAPDPWRALVVRPGAIPRDCSGILWKIHCLCSRVSPVGASDGGGTLHGQSSSFNPVQSGIRGTTANRLFPTVLFDFGLQR